MEELEYTLATVRRAIASELEKVAKHVASLQEKSAQGDVSDWTDGFVSHDVAKLTALLGQQQALQAAICITKKNQ